MRKLVSSFGVTMIAVALLFSSCHKADSPVTPAPKVQKVSTFVFTDPSQVHDPLLNAFDQQFPIQPEENYDHDKIAELVENMSIVAEQRFGPEAAAIVRERGAVIFDELGAYNSDGILDMQRVDAAIIAAEPDTTFKRVLTNVSTFSGTGNIVDFAKNQFGGYNTPSSQAYISLLAGSLQASKSKEGVIGILQTPQYPMKSHHDQVAAADAAGYKNEFTVATSEGAGFTVALYRAGLVASLFSAVRERELVAKGE